MSVFIKPQPTVTLSGKGLPKGLTIWDISLGGDANLRQDYSQKQVQELLATILAHGYHQDKPIAICAGKSRDTSPVTVARNKEGEVAGTTLELEDRELKITGDMWASVASGDELDWMTANGRTRLLALRLASLMGLDVQATVQIVEDGSAFALREANAEEYVKRHERLDLIIRGMRIVQAQALTKESDIARALGIQERRTVTQEVVSRVRYCLRFALPVVAEGDAQSVRAVAKSSRKYSDFSAAIDANSPLATLARPQGEAKIEAIPLEALRNSGLGALADAYIENSKTPGAFLAICEKLAKALK